MLANTAGVTDSTCVGHQTGPAGQQDQVLPDAPFVTETQGPAPSFPGCSVPKSSSAAAPGLDDDGVWPLRGRWASSLTRGLNTDSASWEREGPRPGLRGPGVGRGQWCDTSLHK